MKKVHFGVRRLGLSWLLLLLSGGGVYAQTNYTVLTLLPGPTGASVPFGGLIWGTNGALYGTTADGGVSNAGTVFKVNPDGTGLTVLKSFLVSDGAGPDAALTLGTNGELYGVTYVGGISNYGTVFRVDENGSNFKVLHYFQGGTDGASPKCALLAASDGFLYGTTYFFNSATRGTIFKIDLNGSNYALVHTFTGNPDGQQPAGRLIQSTNGLLYGTTVFGGANLRGTVYSTDGTGNSYLAFYSFTSSDSLGGPEAGVLEGSDGLLYGTLYHGGTNSNGSIFALAKDASSYAVLHKFSNTNGDGLWPNTDLVEGDDGYLYGLTGVGGSYPSDPGMIYKVDKSGSNYVILRDLDDSSGYSPAAGFLKGTNGLLYGTTEFGANSAGTIFVLSPNPLPPLVLGLAPTNGSNIVQFRGTSSLQYDVQRSTNLNSAWTPLGTFTAPLEGRLSYTDAVPPAPAGFYRLKQD